MVASLIYLSSKNELSGPFYYGVIQSQSIGPKNGKNSAPYIAYHRNRKTNPISMKIGMMIVDVKLFDCTKNHADPSTIYEDMNSEIQKNGRCKTFGSHCIYPR